LLTEMRLRVGGDERERDRMCEDGNMG